MKNQKTLVLSLLSLSLSMLIAQAAHSAQSSNNANHTASVQTREQILSCETLDVFTSPTDKQTVPGSIEILKIGSENFEVHMKAGDKADQTSGVEIEQLSAKDIDLSMIEEILKVVSPTTELAKMATVQVANILPVNKGDSSLTILDLKDESKASMIKLLVFDQGAAVGRCAK